jgi:hypothetical protein
MASQDLMNEYNAYTKEVQDFMNTGDENDLKLRMNKAADYNKPIREEQARVLEDKNQIINRYNSRIDPMLAGLDVDQQQRMMAYDNKNNSQNAALLGDYMSAREGTLADTVSSWKTAWNTRLTAAQAAQAAKQQAWQMAFNQENEMQRRKEAEAARAQAMAIARMQAANANKPEKRTSLSDAINKVGSVFKNERMVNGKMSSVADFAFQGADGKTTWKTREQVGREIAAETGLDYKTQVMPQVYATYRGKNGY